MPDPTPDSIPLPDNPNLDWLRKQAKRRLAEMRKQDPEIKLAGAQFDLAKRYGFSSWRALKARVDSISVEGRLLVSARTGDVRTLAALLNTYPEKLTVRTKPYGLSLLHLAAGEGHLASVDLLLLRGLDVNNRDEGDNTYAMHWAAAGGHLEVVRRLADAGGDVIGHGDDHGLEVIGWATCWEDVDQRRQAVVELLIGRGARHNIFSAIAMNLADEVRRIVAADPSSVATPMSHNEDYQRPLHFAVRKNRPRMISLLLELGADPLATDGSGYTAAAYATEPDVDRSVMETIRARGAIDLFTALALGDWATAERLVGESSGVAPSGGTLAMMAKRGDAAAVKWLLDHGADPNVRWSHWDAVLTPLHLAAGFGHADVVRLLLGAGADPRVPDSKHDSDPKGWAVHFGRQEIVRLFEANAAAARPASP